MDDDGPPSAEAHAKKSIPLTIRCHVCGQLGHKAGFKGTVYVDCPNKPCYLWCVSRLLRLLRADRLAVPSSSQ